MSPAADHPPPILENAVPVSTARVLRRLFLTLFLRGRSSRGLQKETAPKSVAGKLTLTLVLNAALGFLALFFLKQPVFVLSLYLHGMTLMFVGMFVAASAGELLFNKDEGDILLHRPVAPRTLLWAKVRVLVEVSLWLAGAFNLVGLVVGVGSSDGSWLYPLAHLVSTAMEALLCTGCVVLGYQLCLRWFGREWLDGVMTAAQVLVAVAAVVAGQVIPRLIGRHGFQFHADLQHWWMGFLPPAWFAAWDDALAGSGRGVSWLLALVGVLVTGTVLWLAFGKLSEDYGSGLQTLNETRTRRRGKVGGRRWLDVMVDAPPLRWWLRDSVCRASFLLTAAYMVRDRETKLRLYPGLAPILIMPVIMLTQGRSQNNGFMIALVGTFLGMVPMTALQLLRYSQQWQAADLFRAAPIAGPALLGDGARRAVTCFLTLPILLGCGLIAKFYFQDQGHMALLLPGIISLPIFSLVTSFGDKAVPFSQPTEEAKSAGQGVTIILVMTLSMALASAAAWSWAAGYFKWLVMVEIVVVASLYGLMRRRLSRARWGKLE
jgi:hypothetical protein